MDKCLTEIAALESVSEQEQAEKRSFKRMSKRGSFMDMDTFDDELEIEVPSNDATSNPSEGSVKRLNPISPL
jgi:hypothetical protein